MFSLIVFWWIAPSYQGTFHASRLVLGNCQYPIGPMPRGQVGELPISCRLNRENVQFHFAFIVDAHGGRLPLQRQGWQRGCLPYNSFLPWYSSNCKSIPASRWECCLVLFALPTSLWVFSCIAVFFWSSCLLVQVTQPVSVVCAVNECSQYR